MTLWVFWLIVIFILTFIEVSTVNLVSIWFIASALISLIVSLFVDNLYLGIAIFTIVGVLLLLTTKKMLEKMLKGKKGTKTNLDRIIGEIGIVTENIAKDSVGEVKVDGKRWSAIADEDISVNTKVIIEDIKGVKLKVRKEEV